MSKRDRIRKYGEVFTPDTIVRQMCDALEEQNPAAFDVRTTYLEPTCGDGAFVTEILRRKFLRCRMRTDYMDAVASVYGMEIQPENVQATIARVKALCEAHFHPTPGDLLVIEDHFMVADSLKVMKMMRAMP